MISPDPAARNQNQLAPAPGHAPAHASASTARDRKELEASTRPQRPSLMQAALTLTTQLGLGFGIQSGLSLGVQSSVLLHAGSCPQASYRQYPHTGQSEGGPPPIVQSEGGPPPIVQVGLMEPSNLDKSIGGGGTAKASARTHSCSCAYPYLPCSDCTHSPHLIRVALI